MANTELSGSAETKSGLPVEAKKSDAASRILRAVEKSRGETTARIQIAALPPPAPVPGSESANHESKQEQKEETPAPAPVAETPARVLVPKIGVDAREALRSLSERQSPRISSKQAIPAPAESTKNDTEAAPEAKSERPEKTVSEILQATKPAVTAPVAEDVKSAKAVKAAKNAQSGKNGKAEDVSPATPSEPEKVESKPAAANRVSTPFEAPTLGMGPNPSQSFWANIPVVAKAGIAVLILGVGAGFLFKFGSSDAGKKPGATQARPAPVLAPMSGIGGWTSNWGDPAKMQGRTISLFRPSLQHADYRIQFDGQIEAKAFGWVFRAKDPQNYYAYKIETVKSGLQPLVALARISVVAGVESQKHYTLLETPVRPDTVFHIKMDSVGSEFTTRVNDQLVEVWQDDRLRMGGVGLFSDPGERAQIRKVQIFEMR